MPLNIRNEQVNQLAERLASRLRLSKTDAVKVALENELDRQDRQLPLRVRLQPLQARIRRRPETGLAADKAFFDDLSDGS